MKGSPTRNARSVSAAITSILFVSTLGFIPSSSADDCPAGYERRDPVAIAREFQPQLTDRDAALVRERTGDSICIYRHLPESAMEIAERNEDPGRANVPEGVLRRAVEQKLKMIADGTQSRVPNATAPAASTSNGSGASSTAAAREASLQAKVANASGQWKPYGKGPEVSDPNYPEAYVDGIPVAAGRVDSFAYDPAAKRLFAAVTYAGVWMTEAKDGDVGTLGDKWVAIGDNLPTLINSAVAWTKAKGGRILTLTGEHTQGGNTYVGLGGYWSGDLGKTWHRSAGLPDGAGAAKLAVDLSNPNIIYAATHKGLFRSTDAGDSFVNVRLPVSEKCAGVVDNDGPCQLANVVSDVTLRQPGGSAATSCSPKGCSVLAAVGYRAGNKVAYLDGTPQSPGNGLYRSETGEPGTFVKLNPSSLNPDDTGGLAPLGFAPSARVGRVEMSTAEGPEQDHNYVYAIVQDAVLLNKGIPAIDIPTDERQPQLPIDCSEVPPGDPRFVCETISAGFSPTTLNGVYVSPDFGTTWVRLADDVELTYNPATGSTLAWVVPLGIGPGVQAWYDLWIKPDPTQAIGGVPTRLAFGMEELWKNRLNVPLTGLEQTPDDFRVFGTYFAGTTCLFLVGRIGVAGITPQTPVCPTYDGIINGTTTHPDQHDGIFIPDEKRGGVWLFAGHDGGVNRQYSGDPLTDDFSNSKWGSGVNQDFYTLFNYGISVAKDGTVWYGLQDNASGKIEGEGGRQVRTYVGDGVYTAVDPDNSKLAYLQTPELAIVRTKDGGVTHESISPDDTVGIAHFLSPFRMDPRDRNHLVAAGTKVAELLTASTYDPGDSETGEWTTVFDLGTDAATETPHQSRSLALAVDGDAVYVGWCGPCNVLKASTRGKTDGTELFQRGLATNVGGQEPAKKGTAGGWHQASMKGLPNRYIYDIEIDRTDPRTIYVVLGNYSTSRWLDAPQYEDKNPNIGEGHVFKSTDAGEHFVDISGNLPDIVTTAVILTGDQLIVGTDIGAFISSDVKGSLWAPLGSLPNVPVNELVVDPADPNRIFAATWGRGVQMYTLSGETSVLPSAKRRLAGKPVLPATGLGDGDIGVILLVAAALMARFNRRRKLDTV